jgi:hypothetical protein
MLCSEDFKFCFILSSIFMKQTHSNCLLADHLSMGAWWSQPCVSGILSLTCLHLVEVPCPLLMSPAWFYFVVHGFSSSWHSFSSRVCMVKFRHAWFLRAAASWWARGFCFVLHLVSTLLVLLSSMVGFFSAGGFFLYSSFNYWRRLVNKCRSLGRAWSVLAVHVFLRAATCGWAHHHGFVVYNLCGSP